MFWVEMARDARNNFFFLMVTCIFLQNKASQFVLCFTIFLCKFLSNGWAGCFLTKSQSSRGGPYLEVGGGQIRLATLWMGPMGRIPAWKGIDGLPSGSSVPWSVRPSVPGHG